MDNKYKYSYIEDGTYCYPHTDILKNKLGIKDDDFLFETERKLVSLRVDELISNPLKGNFDFSHLKAIHKYLFQDIYSWAGKPRTCAIAKKDLFCLPEYIESYSKEIFDKLKSQKYFINYSYDEKINSLVELFADINALHPFREGNGRTQREFIESLAKINGIMLDLTQVPKMEMIIASHDSINGNYKKLTKMFIDNAKPLTLEQQLNYINLYCLKDIYIIIIKEL